MDINIQTLLGQMREEQRQDHTDLSEKLDVTLAILHEHDKRIFAIENTKKTLVWMAGTVVVAFVGAILDFMFVHIPRFIHSLKGVS